MYNLALGLWALLSELLKTGFMVEHIPFEHSQFNEPGCSNVPNPSSCVRIRPAIRRI